MTRSSKIQLCIVGIGFATFLAMNSFSLWGFSFLPQNAFGENALDHWNTPLYLSNIIGFFAYFLGTLRFPSHFNKAPFLETVLLISAGMIFLLGFFLTSHLYLLTISSISIGLGTTCCFISWEKTFSLSTLIEAKKQILFGSLLSVLPFGLFFAFGPRGLLFSVALLVFCNLVLLFAALRFPPTEEGAASQHLPPSPKVLFRSNLWKPLLCVAMIGIISPVLESAAPPGQLIFFEKCLIVFSANLVSAVILAFVWFAVKKETTISKAYVILFPVLITALLAFPFIAEQHRFAVLFIGSFGFTLFSIVMMISCLEIAKESQLNLVLVYSLFAGVTYASRLLGDGVAALIGQSALSREVQLLTSVFVLLYGCSVVMFVLMRKSALAKAATAAPQGVDVLQQACQQLAASRGLSARQAEVLGLLAHGYDVPSIAKKLFISENTVRTHTKKIYTLLEVHSRQEIIDTINNLCESSESDNR